VWIGIAFTLRMDSYSMTRLNYLHKKPLNTGGRVTLLAAQGQTMEAPNRVAAKE
jgi:hypothetical protein